MARRLKSLDRSRRSPVLLRPLAFRPGTPQHDTSQHDTPQHDTSPVDGSSSVNTASGHSSPTIPAISAEELALSDDLAGDNRLGDGPRAIECASAPPLAAFPPPASFPPPPQSTRPPSPAPAGPAATGWDWFAQWPFPTQFLCFAIVLAAGVAWTNHSRPNALPTHTPTATTKPTLKKPRPHPRPELFDWLNRLRETQIVTDQLEAEFADAQEFYREYALDEFLEFDPWSLGADEVATLTHFCDHGFFTVEREILIRILERKLIDQPADTPLALQGAAARLEAAAHSRESRLASLREAADLYRRGRSAEIIVPASLTPEEDQARRARLVDKLAAVRRDRDRLDARIADLNAQLR